MANKDVWIDPPSGWHWGFPKIKKADDERDMYTWLIENGYPPAMLTISSFDFIRQWEVGNVSD